MAPTNAREFFENLEQNVDPAKAATLNNSYLFDVEGAGTWLVDAREGNITVSEGASDADVTINISEETFLKINRGELKPANAFMTGAMKVKGDMGAAMKLDGIL